MTALGPDMILRPLDKTRIQIDLERYYSEGVNICSQYGFPLQYLRVFFVVGGRIYVLVEGRAHWVKETGTEWHLVGRFPHAELDLPVNKIKSGAFLVMPTKQEAIALGLPEAWTWLFPRYRCRLTLDEIRERVINPKPKVFSKSKRIDRSKEGSDETVWYARTGVVFGDNSFEIARVPELLGRPSLVWTESVPFSIEPLSDVRLGRSIDDKDLFEAALGFFTTQ